MNIKLEKSELAAMVSTVKAAVATNSSLPVLKNFLLKTEEGSATLSATDLEISMSCEISTNGDPVGAGAVTVPAEAFGGLISALPSGQVSIEHEGKQVKVTAGRSRYRINSLPFEEFPEPPVLVNTWNSEIPSNELRALLKRILPALGKDDTRPHLTGVLLQMEPQYGYFVATDTHRLHAERLPQLAGPPGKALIPGRAASEISKALPDKDIPACLSLGENLLRVTAGGVTITTRLLEPNYPDWQRIVPDKGVTTWTLDREDVMGALKRARVIVREGDFINRVVLEKNDNEELSITGSGGLGDAEEEIPLAASDGQPMRLGVNTDYLIAALDACPGDWVTLEISDPLKPFKITPLGETGFLAAMAGMNLSA